MERILDEAPRAWLEGGGGGLDLGFNPIGWQRSVWLLNPMYETPTLPSGLSHDDVRRIEEAAGVERSDVESGIEQVIAEITSRPGTVLRGGSLGWAAHPGDGWERVLWSEIGARTGTDPYAAKYLDGSAFPTESWPVNVEPATEGSMDVEGYRRLVEHLGAVSSSDAMVFAFYGLLPGLWLDGLDPHDTRLYSLSIDELTTFLEDEYFPCSPSNIWPVDRSWFVYTDHDLWATKVSGSAGLIDALIDDPEFETLERP